MAKNLQKLINTEKQLAEANVKIKNERLTAIGEVSASMAHNIKNPLATIKSSAEILQKNSKNDDERRPHYKKLLKISQSSFYGIQRLKIRGI